MPKDDEVKAWANQRLSSILGIPDVSDVAEYLLGIQAEGELAEFVKGMLPDGSDADGFLSELKAVKSGARPAAPAAAATGKPAGEAAGGASRRATSAGPKGGAVSETAKRLNEARELLSLGSRKANEEAAAYARLQKAMASDEPQARSTGPDVTSFVTEDGTVAFEKKKEDDEFFGFGDVKAKKKKGKKEKSSAVAGSNQEGTNSAEETPEPAKPKISRAARARMLTANLDQAFLVPGRHPTKWVGNGDRYNLVGNCLDCGKILSDQEGAGPCLVCGSEQVYIAETNTMLDGTPVDQQLMAKRRRGGGDEGELDEHDLQMLEDDPAAAAALLRALDLRDKLIDFEQHRAERTVVIDDQSDYFDSSSHWLTDDQRAKAERAEKEFMARLDRRRGGQPVMFSIDIAGRRIYGGDSAEAEAQPGGEGEGEGEGEAGRGEGAGEEGGARGGGRGLRGPRVDLMGPTGQQDMALGAQYTPKAVDLTNNTLSGRALEVYNALRLTVKDAGAGGRGKAGGGAGGGRVQHEAYMGGGGGLHLGVLEGGDAGEGDLPGACGAGGEEVGGCADEAGEVGGGGGGEGGGMASGLGGSVESGEETGMCLSMHQPWASLVVHGIKQVEGRNWPTRHRGRLWIASTKRKPLEEELDQVLAQYAALQELRPAHAPVFKEPEAYPTSALLGCVDVVDCVDGQQLRDAAEDGEEATECEYGFVLDRPCRLTVPPRALGQPKIFKLEPVVVSRAQKQLRHVIPIG